MRGRLLAALGLLGVLAILAPPGASAATARPRPLGPVTVVGAPGLRWDDVTRATPTLWRLAQTGAVGALSVRSGRTRTCPQDGWLTLGAGNRARGGHSPRCRAVSEADLARWPEYLADNRRLEFGAVLGALGRALPCVTTQGAGARLATGPVPARRQCRTRLVDVDALARWGRTAQARRAVDEAVAGEARALPPGGTLIVVGVSELGRERSHLHVAIARGPGFPRGALGSASTLRAPYVQLIDVAPTVLALAGVDPPPSVVGQPWRAAPGAAPSVASLVDLDRAAQAQRRLVPPFFVLLVASQALLYLVAYAALRRLDRPLQRDRVRSFTRVAALAFAAAPAATYLAQLVPWWRAGRPLAALLLAVVAAVAALTGLALAGPWRRAPLGPTGAVAGLSFAVLAIDVVTGSRLQMSSLAGYSPLVAGRFTGLGNVAFGVFAAAALLFTAALAARRSRSVTVAIVAAVAVAAVAVDGSPAWGADLGGVLALVPAFAVLGTLLTGARVAWRRLALAGLVAVAVVAAFALADHLRPPEVRSHLGRFVTQVREGTAGVVVRRKLEANLHLLTTSVLTLLVPVAVVFLAAVLHRPTRGLRRAFEREPALRAGLLAVLVLGVVGFLVNDSGVAVPALAMSVAIPAAIAVALTEPACGPGRGVPLPDGEPRTPCRADC